MFKLSVKNKSPMAISDMQRRKRIGVLNFKFVILTKFNKEDLFH